MGEKNIVLNHVLLLFANYKNNEIFIELTYKKLNVMKCKQKRLT